MTERIYTIAGLRLRVAGPEQWIFREEGVLASFTASDSWDHSVEFEVVEQLSDPEGQCVHREPAKQIYVCGETQLRYEGAVKEGFEGAYLRIARRGNTSRVQVKRDAIPCGITSKLIMGCMEAEHLVAAAGGFLLHASCIRVGDKAVLFTAPSGTGKSTQAKLWCDLRGAELINGDRAAVFPCDGGAQVRGIPFCGSSGVAKNETLPLAAIVYLSQAPSTTINQLSGIDAFRKIWEGCSVNVWNQADLELCSQSVLDTVSTVPVYHLACTPDETAVVALEEVLK